MRKKITLSDLTAKSCYCTHENEWEDRPFNGETVRTIDEFIKKCPRALGGLNIGCAHYYMQDIKWIDWLFVEHLRWHAEKNRLQTIYKQLHQLKRYLDQLTRTSKWIYIDELHDPEYVDDPRLAASVCELSPEDGLRRLFESIVTCQNSVEKTQLLHQAEDMIIWRMNDLLGEVRSFSDDEL